MNKVKYIRISSSTQNEARQKVNEDKFHRIYSDCVSGSVSMAKRPEGGRLLADIQNGKVNELHVSNFDRLGRNAADTLTTIEICNANNVCIVVESLQLQSMINGKTNPMFKLVSSIFSVIAEQERENIRERCEQGIAVAIANGKRWGRRAGEKETKKTFLSKPKVSKIVNYIKERPSLTTRELALINKCSLNLVVKIKKMIEA